MAKGVHKKRFSLTFNKTIDGDLTDTKQNLKLNYNKNDKTLILTCLNDLELNTVGLFDILGANLNTWENIIKDKKIHVLNLQKQLSGLYILRIKTNYGIITKKLFIN